MTSSIGLGSVVASVVSELARTPTLELLTVSLYHVQDDALAFHGRGAFDPDRSTKVVGVPVPLLVMTRIKASAAWGGRRRRHRRILTGSSPRSSSPWPS